MYWPLGWPPMSAPNIPARQTTAPIHDTKYILRSHSCLQNKWVTPLFSILWQKCQMICYWNCLLTYVNVDATFPPALWAAAPTPDNYVPRTTNACEAYHRHLKQAFNNASPNSFRTQFASYKKKTMWDCKICLQLVKRTLWMQTRNCHLLTTTPSTVMEISVEMNICQKYVTAISQSTRS